MSLFGNYNTPGRGVLKAPQEKKGIFKFFEVYGRHMWKLMELNLLYFVFCIPMTLMVILMLMTSNPIWLLLAIPSVLVGPATAAMTKVCRNYSQERNAFLLHDFWDSFKKNFKQGTIMGAIDIIFAIGFMVGIPMYKYWAEQNSMIYIPFVICISCLIVFFMMHFYIYLMISSTNLNMKQIIKNSFYLVSLGIKQSLWSLLASLIVIVMMYLFLPYSLFILPFWPLSFICFVTCFNCYPVIRKHVIQPYYDQRGESNPEFAYKNADPDEQLFEDRAVEETPVKTKESRKKGKTIS